jgi:hypothetical protein
MTQDLRRALPLQLNYRQAYRKDKLGEFAVKDHDYVLGSSALCAIIAVFLGCAKPDLTITELSVTSCDSSQVHYSFEVLNRDFTGNLFTSPAGLGRDVGVQAYVSSTTTLDQYDSAEHRAGGMTIFTTYYGPDQILSPGEAVSLSFQGGSMSIDPVQTPYLVLKVDPKNIFDPESTKKGKINEYDEANNERYVLLENCN